MYFNHPDSNGKLFEFNQSNFQFRTPLLEQVNRFLASNGLKSVNRLEDIHLSVSHEKLNDLYSHIYRYFESPGFLALYGDFITKFVLPQVNGKYHFQRKPCIRIQLPGAQTAHFHTDEWAGHGPEIVNLWMPLSRAFDTNALHLVSRDDSIRVCEEFKREQKILDEITSTFLSLSKPVNCDFGSLLVFDSKTGHGTLKNETGSTRVSMDFRLVAHGGGTGAKDLEEYYAVGEKRKTIEKPLNGSAYFFTRTGFTKLIRPQYQRLIIKEYARQVGVVITEELAEAYTFDHYPYLQEISKGIGTTPIESVVLFSVLCLPEDEKIRKIVYRNSRDTSTPLFFANEQLNFPACGEEAIEAARKSSLDV